MTTDLGSELQSGQVSSPGANRLASDAGTLATPPRGAAWLAAATLAQREWVRFIRQPNRVVGAVGQPVLFWILFGAGLGPSFVPGGASGAASYREYFFPGTLALILLFTAIFTTISIIEDRREGFLQGVLVSPAPRWSVVLGKLTGGTAIAWAQGMLFLVLGLIVGIPTTAGGIVGAALLSAVLAFGLTGLGFMIAWRLDSTQGFHAVMSIFLLPMWLLSGAFFPVVDGWLGWIMRANPMTYAVAGLQRCLAADATAGVSSGLPTMVTAWLVTLSMALVTFLGSWWLASRPSTGETV